MLLIAGLTLQSQTKDTVYVVEKDTVLIAGPESIVKPVNYELGLAIGRPGQLNLVGVIHSENFLWKLSGGHVGFPYGAQADFGVKLSEEGKTYSTLCAGVGFWVIDPIVKASGIDNIYKYFTINSTASSHGFYFNFGLSLGTGASTRRLSYVLIGQLGYAYQFR